MVQALVSITNNVFEAEWDCQGDIPAVSKLLTNNASECPPQVERAVVKYYKRLQEFILTGDHWEDWGEFEKFSDVWAKIKVLPQGVVFPKDCGSLDLSGLTSLPQGVVFPKDCGYLYLRGDLKAQLKHNQPGGDARKVR